MNTGTKYTKHLSGYKPRYLDYLGIYKHIEFTFKIYTITKSNEKPCRQIIDEVKQNIAGWLDKFESVQEHYNSGILLIHFAADGIYVLLSRWVNGNILQHKVYFKGSANANEYEVISDIGFVFCVWELAVYWHERNYWIEHILSKPSKPEFDKYFNSFYSGCV